MAAPSAAVEGPAASGPVRASAERPAGVVSAAAQPTELGDDMLDPQILSDVTADAQDFNEAIRLWAAALGRPTTWASWQRAASAIGYMFPESAPERKGPTPLSTLMSRLRVEVMTEIYGQGWERLPGAKAGARPNAGPRAVPAEVPSWPRGPVGLERASF